MKDEIEKICASYGYTAKWREDGRVCVNDPMNPKLSIPEYRARVENHYVLPIVALIALTEHVADMQKPN